VLRVGGVDEWKSAACAFLTVSASSREGTSIAAAATTCIRWLTTTSRARRRVVEMPAVLDAERLRHRDLDGVDVVAVPDRLEHRVLEAQVEDLVEPIFPR
jgi:hypothetical protein